jgi:hypothetical protein
MAGPQSHLPLYGLITSNNRSRLEKPLQQLKRERKSLEMKLLSRLDNTVEGGLDDRPDDPKDVDNSRAFQHGKKNLFLLLLLSPKRRKIREFLQR